MKVSKVKHTRMAVSAAQGVPEGILYPDPNVKNSDGQWAKPQVMDIGEHFDTISENAKELYNILNPEIPKKRYGKVHPILRSKIGGYFKKLVEFNDQDNINVLEEQLKFIDGCSDNMSSYFFFYKDKKKPNVKALVNTYLRKTLRKNVKSEEGDSAKKIYLPTVAEKLIDALCFDETTTKAEWPGVYQERIKIFKKKNDKELKTFLKSLNNDYNRTQQKARVINSIKKQNVKAKVIEKEGLCLLQPSFADHSKKHVIFDFMLRFAVGTEKERSDLLNYMRGLIVLYVCGVNVYNGLFTDDFILKDFSAPLISEDLVFCEKASILLKKGKAKNQKDFLKKAYEHELVEHYQAALKVFEAEAVRDLPECVDKKQRVEAVKKKIQNESFWLDFIEQEVKGTINLSRPYSEYKNNALYLCRKVWKKWTAFMAEKYIDLGKAVYHFAMPDMPSDNKEPVKYGIVRKEYENGLTSFDYERIKAVENMERNVSIAVTFAVNNFSRSVLKNPAGDTTDVLFLNSGQLDGSLYENKGHRILRYFGGASIWADNNTVSEAAKNGGDALFKEIKEQLESLRNGSYHYTQKFDDVKSNIVPAMLDSEKAWIGPIIRKKYYSNNTHWFYPEDKLNGLMVILYKTPAVRGDQVPAFSRLYNRNTLFEEERIFTPQFRGKINSLGNEKAEIFKGAAFFLFKEIYYYSFLKDNCIAEVFRKLVSSDEITNENADALDDFRERMEDISEEATLGELAQVIMTDYNLQNQMKETVQIVSTNKVKASKEKYKAFPMILYKFMRLTFLDFLGKNKDKFGFLYECEPGEQTEQIGFKEADFCAENDGQRVGLFRKLTLEEEGQRSVAPWFVLGHMIPPAQLNHLYGDLRSYICYLRNIDRRADQTGNDNRAVTDAYRKEADYFERVLEVLEFCRFFCGKTSKQYTDYYPKGTYAGEVFKYVDVKNYLGAAADASDEEILAAFCDQKAGIKNPDGTDQKIKIFHDGENLILNRNMVLASLYGTDRIIQNAADKVTEDDIFEYYKLWNTLMRENTGVQMGEKERCEKNRELQNRKNHIELVDIKIYSDILNDLMIQMVSWAYFRERDQLYLALGTQYLRLYYGDHMKEGSLLRKLSWKGTVNGKDIDINIDDGAVLYQIAALYTYHLPLYQVKYDESGNINEIKERRGMSGSKQQYFDSYCRSQDVALPTQYFFEVAADSKKIRALRNFIDHFAYFVNADRSILDLYSDIYNIFSSYSENYRKSVTFILPNILSRYFVLTRLHMDKETRKTANANNVIVSRNCAGIRLDKELKSFQLTYNVEGDAEDKAEEKKEGSYSSKTGKGKGKKGQSSGKSSNKKKTSVKVAARDGKFLKDVKQILCYHKR